MSNIARCWHHLNGITQLDDEHLELITLATELENNPASTSELIAIQIANIVQKFHEHLMYEEFLMDSVNYPYAVYHKHHRVIHEMLRAFTTTSHQYAVRHSTRTLSDHFISHADHHDLQFAHYLRANQP